MQHDKELLKQSFKDYIVANTTPGMVLSSLHLTKFYTLPEPVIASLLRSLSEFEELALTDCCNGAGESFSLFKRL